MQPFINNKYTATYFRIINNALAANRTAVYVEKHHILPKSIGGSNKQDNLVKLTAREHFVCHWLLTKMTDFENKRKMEYALYMISMVANGNQPRYKISSRMYSQLKLMRQNLMAGHIPWNKGMIGCHSAETRQKISNAGLGRVQTKETIAKRVAKTTGKHRTEEQRKRASDSQKGKSLTDRHKQKLSNSAKNRKTPSRKKGDSTLPGPTSKTWLVNGITVVSLRKWCLENGVNYSMTHRAFKNNSLPSHITIEQC